jgi:hypothetical protein
LKTASSKTILLPGLFLIALGSVTGLAQQPMVPAGVPLRIQVDKRYPLKAGTRIEGHLIAPVFLVDREVLPVNTVVTGTIVATHPVDGKTRANALLNGDFTPLATPEVRFDKIVLPDRTAAGIETVVYQRNAAVVHMRSSGKKPSLPQQAKTEIEQRKQDALNQITKPGKADRLRRFLYGQMPYHPQCIWPGTQFDADLTAPLQITGNAPPALPIEPLNGALPTGTILARITDTLTSASNKQGDVVHAIMTKPLFDSTHSKVLLPEGTELDGSVVQVKPARWFSRNGKLRFTFRQIHLPAIPAVASRAEPQPSGDRKTPTGPVLLTRPIHGQLSAAEGGQGQNLELDSEGGAKATPGKDKYLAPLVLGVLAAGSLDDDAGAVQLGAASNGFGVAVRIAVLATSNRNVAQGFGFFALGKSVYRRWIAKGNEVSFPRDTRVEIDLSDR